MQNWMKHKKTMNYLLLEEEGDMGFYRLKVVHLEMENFVSLLEFFGYHLCFAAVLSFLLCSHSECCLYFILSNCVG